jgi:hypothetical protein
MRSGYLVHEVTTAAFSRDTLSAGRPSPYQIAYSDGVASTPNGSTPSVNGIFLSIISESQTTFHKLSLNLYENGAIYDTKAEDKSASPIIVGYLVRRGPTS